MNVTGEQETQIWAFILFEDSVRYYLSICLKLDIDMPFPLKPDIKGKVKSKDKWA